MKKILLFGIAILLLGCNQTPEQPNYQTIKIKSNQVGRYENDLSIEVKKVDDSRCPQGCQCVWAGEVRVNVNLTYSGNSFETYLCLPSKPRVEFMDCTVELKDVSPYPICDNQSPSDYSFTFVVSALKSL
ncbi:MAG: hypothetical protein EHM93_19840 [Bacteroidales bacterium]|nr:MAG: hypothetical protein EHM93_19840 [Bacteroidales bacterium]